MSFATPLTGRTLGHYRVEEQIGSGGMGVVYRATDTRLSRQVAIKVLPDTFASSPERLARFDREARLLATLSHPYIAAIHGLEQSDGVDYLVMELIPGDTLDERLRGGPLPLEEALAICRQLAEAIEAAHEKGVIHRDLKPGNIKIAPGDKVKVLDFGLAKAVAQEPAAAAAAVSQSPTITMAGSQAGVLLGTAAYMSPEQARGKPVDKRCDIWAFGCVLYECLTARGAFGGETVSDTLAALLRADPDWAALPKDTPPALRRLLQRCLQKDPRQRLRDIGDALLEIDEIRNPPPAAEPPAARRPVTWAVAAGLVILSALGVSLAMRSAAPVEHQPSPARFKVVFPEGISLGGGPAGPNLSVSADGEKIAFLATEGAGASLWIRSLGSFDAYNLEGTAGATSPFWSPDGSFAGFFAEGKLKKVPASGGFPLTICDAPSPRGGAWNQRGDIVFAAQFPGPLSRVAAGGGIPQPATEVNADEGEIAHSYPQFLPDGELFLFLVQNKDARKSGIYVQRLGSKEKNLLLHSQIRAMYADPGRVVYVRDGVLFAQKVSEDLKLVGEPARLTESIPTNPASGASPFAVSRDVLAYRTNAEGGITQLSWYDRVGKLQGSVGKPGFYGEIRLSPDEKHVAIEHHEGTSLVGDLWLLALQTGIERRLTFDPPARACNPMWSPDSQRIAFNKLNRPGIWEIAINSGAVATRWEDIPPGELDDWSPDAKLLVFHLNGPGQPLFLTRLEGKSEPEKILNSTFGARDYKFSPDGRWITYTSSESGRPEIYISSFPSFSEKHQVSKDGGVQPLWRGDGKEVYYLAPDGRLMFVQVSVNGKSLESGSPQPLFQTRVTVNRVGSQYAPSASGNKFLVQEPAGRSPAPLQELNVVVNWANVEQ